MREIRYPDITGLPRDDEYGHLPGGTFDADKCPQVAAFLQEWEERIEVEPEEYYEGRWCVSRLKCIACFKKWVAVYPEAFDGPFLECPRCHKIAGEKQPLEDEWST